MEWYSIKVNDKSVKVGGTQCLTTLDGFAIPLDMQCGLPYLNNADVSILWSPSNVNDDSILMDDLCHLLNAFPFDGCSVVCDPKCHTGSFDDCLDHWGGGGTEHCIEQTEHCVASIIKLQLCFGWNS